MNGIIITSIICFTCIFMVCVVCYSNYKEKNDDNIKYIHKRIDVIHDKLNNRDKLFESRFNSINENIVKIVQLIKSNCQ